MPCASCATSRRIGCPSPRWAGSKRAATRWAILSGGILGLSVLLRFNPLFIAPFLVLAVLCASNWKIRRALPGILLFALAFMLAFGPWFFTATDNAGKNHYFTKIEEVISSRFSAQQNGSVEIAPTAVVTESQVPPAGTVPTTTPTGAPVEEELLRYELGEIDKAGLSGVGYHFLNNVFTSLTKLPTTLVLHPIEEQVTDGIWTFTEAQPLWKTSLRAENLIAIALNLALILVGVMAAWKRFGVAGLAGLIIQLGYFTGNAFSQTSGGRYLEPVFWISIIYYCLGIFTLTRFGVRLFSRKPIGEATHTDIPVYNQEDVVRKERKWVNPVLLAGFLVCGFALPALNLIPAVLPQETDPAVEEAAFEALAARGLVTQEQWDNFLQDPNRIVIQGRAYHPRYYRSDFYRPGNLSFEIMLLAKDHVLVGYSPRMTPVETFSDGSDVILVGCRIRRDTLWGARRVIVESIAIIQLDHEASFFFDDKNGMVCTH